MFLNESGYSGEGFKEVKMLRNETSIILRFHDLLNFICKANLIGEQICTKEKLNWG